MTLLERIHQEIKAAMMARDASRLGAEKRPLTRREQLERDLHEAVGKEDYERAARVRDELKNLKPND